MQHLDRLVQQCDRRIEKNKQRAEELMTVPEEDLRRVAALQTQADELTDQCEAAGLAGDIDTAALLLARADSCRDQAARITAPYLDKTMTVCEISGNFLSSK
jgi:phage shock protein A